MSRFPKPAVSDMFADAATAMELSERYDQFRATLNKTLDAPRPAWNSEESLASRLDDQRDSLNKSVSSATIDSVRNALTQSELNKDWSTSSPLSSGLVAYDLAPAALLLAPRPTPLRNRIARVKGQGLNHQYKRILGYSGTRTGGAAGAPIRPGIDETTTNTFGPGNISYARGPKIQYASDEKVSPYVQCGLSDEVSFAAQFAGQGFTDIRQLSSTALLYASMLSEEALLLGGRGTRSGYGGAILAPTGVTVGARTAAAGETGNSADIPTVYVRVTSTGTWGESVSSTEVSTTTLSAATGKVLDITFANATGALSYNVYVGTSPGAANCHIAVSSNGQPITVDFTGGGTGGAPNSGATAPTTDTTAAFNEYDGILTHVTGTESGYVGHLNATLTSDSPFQDAFASLWDSVKADPDELLASGNDRRALSDILKNQSSSNYEINLINGPGTEGSHGATLGALAVGVQNQQTGKMLPITVHPWLPQGTIPIISWTLPVPDSNVGNCWEVRGPRDFEMYNWPTTQFLYEASTYWFNTLISYAPAWSGCIQGILR